MMGLTVMWDGLEKWEPPDRYRVTVAACGGRTWILGQDITAQRSSCVCCDLIKSFTVLLGVFLSLYCVNIPFEGSDSGQKVFMCFVSTQKSLWTLPSHCGTFQVFSVQRTSYFSTRCESGCVSLSLRLLLLLLFVLLPVWKYRCSQNLHILFYVCLTNIIAKFCYLVSIIYFSFLEIQQLNFRPHFFVNQVVQT